MNRHSFIYFIATTIARSSALVAIYSTSMQDNFRCKNLAIEVNSKVRNVYVFEQLNSNTIDLD